MTIYADAGDGLGIFLTGVMGEGTETIFALTPVSYLFPFYFAIHPISSLLECSVTEFFLMVSH